MFYFIDLFEIVSLFLCNYVTIESFFVTQCGNVLIVVAFVIKDLVPNTLGNAV